MARMTGGEALVKSLVREGVSTVFGLPGVQTYGVIAALRDEPGIRFITTRHEQATSFMADGYARAGGTIGTALVVPGPGLLNAASGLSTAYSASSPVLMISGQVPKAQIGKNIGVLHEVNDQLDAIAPVTKWRRRVLEIRDVPAAVREAFLQLRTGRHRSVVIDMPPDTMQGEDDVELLSPISVAPPAAERKSLDAAVALLLAAARPAIYAGGGVHASGAHEVVWAVADHLQAAVAAIGNGSRTKQEQRKAVSVGIAVGPQKALKP